LDAVAGDVVAEGEPAVAGTETERSATDDISWLGSLTDSGNLKSAEAIQPEPEPTEQPVAEVAEAAQAVAPVEQRSVKRSVKPVEVIAPIEQPATEVIPARGQPVMQAVEPEAQPPAVEVSTP